MAKFKRSGPYSEKVVKAKRKMPVRNIVFLVIIVIIQVALILFGALYDGESEPIDIINRYTVTVRPQTDGRVNIEYDITWTALSDDEPLEWVDIGLANKDAKIYSYTVSDTIESYEIISKKRGYCVARIYFKDSYDYGETVRFGFEVDQGGLLATNGSDYLYEFVPGWFNEVPVENYRFRWRLSDGIDSTLSGGYIDGDFYVFEGNLHAGEYYSMKVAYKEEFFDNPVVKKYVPFDGSGASNELRNDVAVLILTIFFAAILIIPEVYIIDSFVSYNRGRGFIVEHGEPVHTYGRTNPAYIAVIRTSGSGYHGGRSGGTGGGCACADPQMQ